MALETVTVAVGPDAESRIEELTEVVLDVAEPAGATVVLLHVFSRSAFEEGLEEAGYDPENPPPAHTLATRLESVDALSRALEEAGVDYRIRGEIGTVTDSIVRAVEDLDADLLFVGGRRRSPTGKAVFGSTVHDLMMNASCPVTFVREAFDEDVEA